MESTLTTKDAFKQIIKCSWVILVNTWNSLNKAVHKSDNPPWTHPQKDDIFFIFLNL